MEIHNLAEANAALLPHVPLVRKLTGKDTVLDRIIPLMELLGNPQNKLKVVHIAGTSGKTSTAYYMAALLREAGQEVGLTISPHIDSITERVQIDGAPLPDVVFCSELSEFLDIVHRSNLKASYFELLYAFAIWVFARHHVDYAVVETGLGGLHDATNVVNRTDKVCIITDIGLDHTEILGDSLTRISQQKIGIVHVGNTVFTYKQADEIMAVFRDWTDECHADLRVVDETIARTTLGTDMAAIADYQQRNWLLAYTAFKYLSNRDELQYLTSQVLRKTQALQIPARMDVQTIKGKQIIMDGAHNLQKITAFIESFRHLYPREKPVLMVAFKQGKEYEEVVPLLATLTDHVIVTTFKTTQDLPVRSSNPETVAGSFRKTGVAQVEVIENNHKAYDALLKTPGMGVIIGSFYLLSQIRTEHTT